MQSSPFEGTNIDWISRARRHYGERVKWHTSDEMVPLAVALMNDWATMCPSNPLDIDTSDTCRALLTIA